MRGLPVRAEWVEVGADRRQRGAAPKGHEKEGNQKVVSASSTKFTLSIQGEGAMNLIIACIGLFFVVEGGANILYWRTDNHPLYFQMGRFIRVALGLMIMITGVRWIS